MVSLTRRFDLLQLNQIIRGNEDTINSKFTIRNSQLLVLFFLFLAFPFSLNAAFTVPAAPTTFIYDSANILSPQAQQQLNQTLSALDQSKGVQLVVATFPSLQGEDIESVSLRIAEAWKIGRSKEDTGLLLTVFTQDRKMRVEVGYGLESVVTDAQAFYVVNNIMKPAFRAQDYDQGVLGAVAYLQGLLTGEVGAAPVPGHRSSGTGLFVVLGLLLFLIYVFGLGGARLGRSQTLSSRGQGRSSFNPWMALWIGSMLGGRGRSSGFDGGGFGGFSGGGGSFGGGGSSGGW